MIKPAFRALLVPGVGPPPLLEASLLAVSGAAIAMAAVAVRADEKHRATLFAHANSLPENPFAVNRHHAFSQAGGRQRQRLRGRLEPAEFGRPHEGRRTRNPVALTAGFLHFPAFPDTITPCSRLVDDRTDDRAFGADDVAPLGPKFKKLRFQMIADIMGDASPAAVQITGPKAILAAKARTIAHPVGNFKDWVSHANEQYRQGLRRKTEEKPQREIDQVKKVIQRAEDDAKAAEALRSISFT